MLCLLCLLLEQLVLGRTKGMIGGRQGRPKQPRCSSACKREGFPQLVALLPAAWLCRTQTLAR